MKYYITTLILIAVFISCNSTETKKENDAKALNEYAEFNALIGIGKILPEGDIIPISTEITGLVANIKKRENDTVNTGTIILVLDHQPEDAQIEQLKNEAITQKAKIKSEMALAKAMEVKYKNAKVWHTRLQELFKVDAAAEQKVADAETEMRYLESSLISAESNIEIAQSRWNEIQSAIRLSEMKRNQKIIKSPVDGIILELDTKIGASISVQDVLGQIRPYGNTIAVCELDEVYADKVSVGQRGYIRNRGSSDTLSTGVIYFTSAFLKKKSLFTDQPGEKEDRRVRVIKMRLDTPDLLLLNSRVECVIPVSHQPED